MCDHLMFICFEQWYSGPGGRGYSLYLYEMHRHVRTHGYVFKPFWSEMGDQVWVLHSSPELSMFVRRSYPP